MKTTFKLLALCGVLTTTLALSSCRDQDFDWESAKKANPEYNYAQNFSQIYGSIDPNQSWDFSYWGRHAGDVTRAGGNKGGTSTLDGEGNTGNSGSEMKPTYITTLPENATKEWKIIDQWCVNWLLAHTSGNNDKAFLGGSFTMEAPYCGFSVSPLFYHINNGNTDVNFKNIELHMCVQTSQLTYDDYLIWTDSGSSDIQASDNGGQTWYDINKVTNGGGVKYNTVKSNTISFGTDTEPLFTPSSTIWFYTKYVGGGNDGDCNYSQGATMVNFYINGAAVYKDENGNEHILIGCELDHHASGGGNYNYGDFIFLIEGLPLVPKREEINESEPKHYEQKTTKRYMVEDMGYSDKGSLAVSKGYTDIDFNDIVVDISEIYSYDRTWITSNNSTIPTVIDSNKKTNQSAKVLALGGTWDFVLKIGGNIVFHKGDKELSSSTYTYLEKNHPVTINEDYPFFKTHNVDCFQYDKIYNAGCSDNHGGDEGYYNPDQYLASFPVDGWDKLGNNIVFEIVDPELAKWNLFNNYGTSTADNNNVYFKPEYSMTFPVAGACPKIIAFDPVKNWQKERFPVTTAWFNEPYWSVDENGNTEIITTSSTTEPAE